MDPSTFYAQGNAEFVEERYAEAVSAYNVAIELADDQAAYFRARAAAQLKLGEFPAAAEDAAAAVRLDGSSAMGHFRLGLANFYLGSYGDALASFKAASSLESSAVWIRKCEAELSGSALPLKGAVAAPAPAPAPAAPPAVPAGPDRSDRKVVKHEWYQTP